MVPQLVTLSRVEDERLLISRATRTRGCGPCEVHGRRRYQRPFRVRTDPEVLGEETFGPFLFFDREGTQIVLVGGSYPDLGFPRAWGWSAQVRPGAACRDSRFVDHLPLRNSLAMPVRPNFDNLASYNIPSR